MGKQKATTIAQLTSMETASGGVLGLPQYL
jgi:hypothetical protein